MTFDLHNSYLQESSSSSNSLEGRYERIHSLRREIGLQSYKEGDFFF